MDRHPFSPSAFQDGYSATYYPYFETHGFRFAFSEGCGMLPHALQIYFVRSSKIKSSAEEH